MEEKILKLKLLSIAYRSALEYDYCPPGETAQEIKDNYTFADKYSISDIEKALSENRGSSPNTITDDIIRLIDELAL